MAARHEDQPNDNIIHNTQKNSLMAATHENQPDDTIIHKISGIISKTALLQTGRETASFSFGSSHNHHFDFFYCCFYVSSVSTPHDRENNTSKLPLVTNKTDLYVNVGSSESGLDLFQTLIGPLDHLHVASVE